MSLNISVKLHHKLLTLIRYSNPLKFLITVDINVPYILSKLFTRNYNNTVYINNTYTVHKANYQSCYESETHHSTRTIYRNTFYV